MINQADRENAYTYGSHVLCTTTYEKVVRFGYGYFKTDEYYPDLTQIVLYMQVIEIVMNKQDDSGYKT